MGCCMVGMVRSAIVFIVISLEYHLDNMLEKINDDHTIMKMLVMMILMLVTIQAQGQTGRAVLSLLNCGDSSTPRPTR